MEVEFEFAVGTALMLPEALPFASSSELECQLPYGMYVGLRIANGTASTAFVRHHGRIQNEAASTKLIFNRARHIRAAIASSMNSVEVLHVMLMHVQPNCSPRYVAGATVELPPLADSVQRGEVVQLSRKVPLYASDQSQTHNGTSVGSVSLRIRCRMATDIKNPVNIAFADSTESNPPLNNRQSGLPTFASASGNLQSSPSSSRPEVLEQLAQELGKLSAKVGDPLPALSSAISTLAADENALASLNNSYNGSMVQKTSGVESDSSMIKTSSPKITVRTEDLSGVNSVIHGRNSKSHAATLSTVNHPISYDGSYSRVGDVISQNLALLSHAEDKQSSIGDRIDRSPKLQSEIPEGSKTAAWTSDLELSSDSDHNGATTSSMGSIRMTKTQILRYANARAPPEARGPKRDTFGRARNLTDKRVVRARGAPPGSGNSTPALGPPRLNKAAQNRANFNKYLMARRAVPPALRYANVSLSRDEPTPTRDKTKKKSMTIRSRHDTVNSQDSHIDVAVHSRSPKLTSSDLTLEHSNASPRQIPRVTDCNSPDSEHSNQPTLTSDRSVIISDVSIGKSVSPVPKSPYYSDGFSSPEHKLSQSPDRHSNEASGLYASPEGSYSSSDTNESNHALATSNIYRTSGKGKNTASPGYQLHLNSDSSETESDPESPFSPRYKTNFHNPQNIRNSTVSPVIQARSIVPSQSPTTYHPLSHQGGKGIQVNKTKSNISGSKSDSCSSSSSDSDHGNATSTKSGVDAMSASQSNESVTAPATKKLELSADERRAQMMARLQAVRDNLKI